MNDEEFEALCIEDLFRLKYKKGMICPRCGRNIYKGRRHRMEYTCALGHHHSPISNTGLAKTNRPIAEWFMTIVWVTENPNITSKELARRLGCWGNSGWQKKRIVLAMMDNPRDKPIIELAYRRMRLGKK